MINKNTKLKQNSSIREDLTLGRRLYSFRKKRNMSQSGIEVEADLSFGTVSRIENGLINPTKETLHRIAKVIDLDDYEYYYLLNSRTSTPTQSEIDSVISEISWDLHNSPFPGYLIDCKYRLLDWNMLAVNMYQLDKDEVETWRGRSIMRIMFLDDVNIRAKIPKRHLVRIVKEQVCNYKYFVQQYKQEDFINEDLKALRVDKDFNKAWQEAIEPKLTSVSNNFYVKYDNHLLNMELNIKPLSNDFRFLMVKYYPQDQETAEVFEELRKIS